MVVYCSHITCRGGGIGIRGGFKTHSFGLRVQVPPPAHINTETRVSLWLIYLYAGEGLEGRTHSQFAENWE